MGGWGKINNIKDDFLPTTLFSMEAFFVPIQRTPREKIGILGWWTSAVSETFLTKPIR